MDSRGRSLAACGGLKTRAAAPIRRLEYNPAGLAAWMPGCLDARRIGLDWKWVAAR